MVDEALLKEMKGKFEAGAAASDVMDTMKVFEMFKQIAEENEDLKEELEDMDIAIQMNITDADKKFWLKAANGTMEFGEGEVENPSFTFSATKEVGSGMLFGEVDATSAYVCLQNAITA